MPRDLAEEEDRLARLITWADRGGDFRIERIGDFPRSALVHYQRAVVAKLKEGKGVKGKPLPKPEPV